ncbi:Zn-ribbon domain-containing OB-fold protein [Yinghuangia sp. YIM S09857]|uniref:Zn-ribbon domain-containing OB-fold protein n=1 Tax=Yinghuangia sp. YIM S09857 TaxID=3436929 RepID=UPI003F534181
MRPHTTATDDSLFFWEAAARGALVAQRCGACGVMRHPPRPMCPHCHSLDHEVVDLSGRGSLYSYALLHHPQHPAFDYPVFAALVELDEGIRLVSNLVDVEPADIRIGMRLEVAFEPTADGGAVPVFRPAGSPS